VQPGHQALLYDLAYTGPVSHSPDSEPGFRVIAASSRIEDYREEESAITFTAKGPRPLQAVARIRCDAKPTAVTAEVLGLQQEDGSASASNVTLPFEWDAKSHTLLLHYEHGDGGTRITVTK